MRTRTRKAPAGCDPARGCQCIVPCLECACKPTSTAKPRQPRPGLVLCFFLRQYLDVLVGWNLHHGDRQTLGLVDCCTVLLNEGKGGRYGA